MKLNQLRFEISGPAILLSFIVLSSLAQGQGANSWKIVGPGGGGTTYDPVVSPYDSRLVVEFSDMTGGYVTHNNGESWRMFNLRGHTDAFAFDPV